MTLTPDELLELKFLVKRLEEESKDRERAPYSYGPIITDKAKDAERVLPALKKLISMVGEH
jgi:hypothetical protein